MAVLLNELSLHNQFATVAEFSRSLKTILDCRHKLRVTPFPLKCTTQFSQCPICQGKLIRHLIGQLPESQRSNLYRWMTKEAPYWDQDPEHDARGTYVYFQDEDNLIIGSAMAEAGHLVKQGARAALATFSPSNYLQNSLTIKWDTDPVGVDVPNFWTVDAIVRHVQAWQPPVDSWATLAERAKQKFPELTFLPDWDQPLAGQPFVRAIANNALRLLDILHQFKRADGMNTAAGNELYQNHFGGERGDKFSNESETNRRKFRGQMTFRLATGEGVFCPWHGKIKYREFRLHFSWPIAAERPLYIAYLGPKITKK